MNENPIAHTNARVLIVDDTPINLQYLGTVLKEKGFIINVAEDGPTAIQMALRVAPDIILLDVTMPGMDGYEACRLLKAEPATREIPVIFLTARAEKEDVLKGFEAGGVDYVVKPFNIRELLARIQTQLELKGLRDQLAATVAELRHKNECLQNSVDRIARLEHAMLRICAWTKQVNIDGNWISIEDYLSNYLGLNLTHGVSEEARQKLEQEMVEVEPLGDPRLSPTPLP